MCISSTCMHEEETLYYKTPARTDGQAITTKSIGVGSGGARGVTRPPKFQVGGASLPQLYPLFT